MLPNTIPQSLLKGFQNYTIQDHSGTLQTGLYTYYREGYLHDAFITTSSRKVLSAHRLVLAAWSPVLHNTFSLVPEVKNILLDDYARQDVQAVVEAMYTGTLGLSVKNYKAVTSIVKKLEIASMEPVCEQFMNDIHLTPPSDSPGEDLKNFKDNTDNGPMPIEISPKTETEENQVPAVEHEAVCVKTEVIEESEMTEVQLPPTELGNICVKSELIDECEEMDTGEINSGVSISTPSKESNGLNAGVRKLGEVEIDRASEPWNLGLDTDPKVERFAVTCHEKSYSVDTQRNIKPEEVKQEPDSPYKSTSDFAFFTCKICGKEFPFYSNLKLHQRRHWQNQYRHNVHVLLFNGCNRYKCKLCGRLFGHSAAVLEHARQTHFHKAQCKDCKRKFTSFIRLQDHRLRVHSKKHILGLCVCLQCCRVFRHQVNAAKHTPCTHSTRTVRTCRHCNQRFRHQRFLHRHETTCILRDYVRDTMQILTISNVENAHQQSHEVHGSENGIKLECNGSDIGSDKYKPQHEDALFDQNVLGNSSPYQLLRTMIYMIDTYFTKLRDTVIIYREQVKVETDEKGTFVSFCDAKLTGSGQLKFASRSPVKLYANEVEPRRCFVRLVRQYLSLSPKYHDYLSPLFLVAKKEKAPCYWYMQRKQGSSTIHKMLKETASSHPDDNSAKSSVATPQKPGNEQLAKPMAIKSRVATQQIPGSAEFAKPNTIKSLSMLTERDFRGTNDSGLASKLPLPRMNSVINIAPITQPREVNSHKQAQCIINLNHWLQGLTGISNARELTVIEKLQIQPGGTIADLPPCKLYFVLRHLLMECRLFNGRNIFTHNTFSQFQDRLLDCEALNHIRLHYNETATAKGYLFEEANIASLLNTKVERWYPLQALPSPVELAAKGLIGGEDPETLLRSVIFLLAATYQLTQADLQALTRATVVIDEDEKGRYLCFCKNTSVSQNHTYVHEHTPEQVKNLSNTLFFNTTELFTQAPMKIYAIKESPESCLVHLMSRYLSMSIPIPKSLFCVPRSRSSKYADTNFWFNQQAVGKRWITNALNQVLGEAGASVDLMFDTFHSQALEHGGPKLEACTVCSAYTKGHSK